MTAYSENTIKLESDYDITCLNELDELFSSSSCNIAEIKSESTLSNVDPSSIVQYTDNSAYFYNNTSISPSNYNSNFDRSTAPVYQYDHSNYYQKTQDSVQTTNSSQFCLQSNFERRMNFQEKNLNTNNPRFSSIEPSSSIESYSSFDSAYSSPPVSPDSGEAASSKLSYYQQTYQTNCYQNASTSSPK